MLGISLYQIKTDDVIASTTSPISDGEGGYKKWYTNLKEQERKGVEFEVKHKFNDNLMGYLNYAWQKGENKNNGNDTEIYSIPKHLLHFGVDYNIGKFNAVLDAQYVSERNEDDGDVVSGAYGAEDAFFVMNTYFNYKVADNATLQFGIDNIFDREYYADYATAGRTYNVSLRYSF